MRKNVMRRRARLLREKQAVSPVVATLILILVAVAAAAALYLWLVAWQGGVTGSIGSPHAQYTVTIGGSTSVFPFSEVAVQQFEQNNSNVVISDNQGGTGAGMLAVCHGSVDIGAASSPQTLSGLETNDQCPSTTVLTVVAYDAVDVILSSANTLGITSMNATVLTALYLDTSSTAPTLALPVGVQGWLGTGPGNLYNPGGGINWNKVPTTANCGQLDATLAAAVAATDCHLSTTNHAVDAYERSDTSGTEQTFTARLIGATSSTSVATSTAGLGFGGCGSDGQLASCAIAVTGENGNPAVISAVKNDQYGIGFASDGLARASGAGVNIVPFAGVGQNTCAVANSACTNGAITPTTGSSGTISAGIQSKTTQDNYVGWRPFTYVTTNTPTGEVARYIQFVMDPANNINFATESAEISIYSI